MNPKPRHALPKKTLGKRIGQIASRYHPIMFAAITGTTGYAAKGFESTDWPFWVLNGAAVVSVIAQAGVGLRLVSNARAAQAEFKLVVYDQLAPLARRLSAMAKEKPEKRKAMRDESILLAITCASGIAGEPTGTRATYFTRAQDRGRDAFKPGPTVGRGDLPQSVFVKGANEEGDAVWAYAERDEPRFVVDVLADPPPGWDSQRKRSYRTFITVPVRSGDRLAGLLTVNAVNPGDLTEDDVGTLQVIASLIGTAIGMSNGT